MGVSPWATPFQLWERKTGRAEEQVSNWAMQRGNDLEPKARATYEMMNNIEMPAQLFVHKDYDWIRASLDGWNADEKKVLEIKCPGKADHDQAKAGKVPEKYFVQLQHQMMVTGADSADYFSFDGEKGVTVNVKADKEFQRELFIKEEEFWNYVTTDTPPPLTDNDVRELIGDMEIKVFKQLHKIKIAIDLAKIEFEGIKKLCLDVCVYPKTICAGVKVTRGKKLTITYPKE